MVTPEYKDKVCKTDDGIEFKYNKLIGKSIQL